MVEASKVLDKVAIEIDFSCILNILESEGRGKGLNCEGRMSDIRDLKQTTTATATRTWKNKRSNWQNNSSARVF